MPQCETKYFRTFSYDEGATVAFSAGLPAFENCRRFLPMEQADRRPFVFLQSLDEPSLCFITLPVAGIDPGYKLKMSAQDLESTGLEGPPSTGTGVLCLAVVSFQTSAIPTANLLAPIVVNYGTRRAVQAVRDDSAYSCCHPLVREVAPCS